MLTALRSIPFCLAVLAGSLLAQEPSKAIRQQVERVGAGLAARNAEDAITPFDKSFDNYERLRDYFTALTTAYSVVSELEVTDEQIGDQDAALTVHWVLVLSDLSSGLSENREENLTIKLNLKKSDWKIVSLEPLDFFNPEFRKSK
jgi:hypothetical protein